MPCPYFVPLVRLDVGDWDPPPRLPLGARFSGECRSPLANDSDGDSDHCNGGYARGVCPHFPEDAPADAVRFSLTSGFPLTNGHQLIYVLEKDHAPLEHGRLPLDQLDGNDILLTQARAFLSSQRNNQRKS